MPLPFQLDHINLWLLADGGGWAIVDTGIGLTDTVALWEQVFVEVLGGQPITRVICTHFHPDHMGNAGWLTERWGVDLWCTQGEWLTAQLVWHQRADSDVEKRLSLYRRHGLDEEAIEAFRQRGNHYPSVVPTLAADYRGIREGDTLAVAGRRWQVLTVHGHAPEHACLWSREDDVLISGDQVLPKITTNVSVWPDQPRSNPLRWYLDSLRRFRPMGADTLVLPSHGLPFRGLHARLDMLEHHHAERLAETLGALTEPRTGVELIPVLFRRRLDTHQLGFAIGEVLAHLHLLEAEGSVERIPGEVYRFRKA
ncbi:MAG: MBL fold metallo-hydrolase [Candidatus Rokubacteria bacterium]|nr:MBL fold metallo-hydrolase [Candidatus Rokubacteria bacterium]MBI3826353.1 MBL fold metallo-hydrolase [Candidatus Rokubacteria bacterium]